MTTTRTKFQFRYSYERDLVDTQAKVTIGSSGAPTLTLAKGIASMTRTSAGLYVITMQEQTNKLMDVTCSFISGSSAPAAPLMCVVSEAVNTSTPTVTIQFRAIDNSTATDPASGEVLLLHIQCRSAST